MKERGREKDERIAQLVKSTSEVEERLRRKEGEYTEVTDRYQQLKN